MTLTEQGPSAATTLDSIQHEADDQLVMLYQQHRQTVRRLARVLSRNDADADDITANVFAGLLRTMRNGHGPNDNVTAYLYAATRREAARVHRRAVTSGHLMTMEADDEPRAVRRGAGADSDHDIDKTVTDRIVVSEALSKLSPRHRRILIAREVEALSHAAIGRELHLSETAAAVLAKRARAAFAAAYLDTLLCIPRGECGRARPALLAVARGSTAPRHRRRATDHLGTCPTCAAAYDDLQRSRSALRSVHAVLAAGGFSVLGKIAPLAAGPAGSVASAATFLQTTMTCGANLLTAAALVVGGAQAIVGSDRDPLLTETRTAQANAEEPGPAREKEAEPPHPTRSTVAPSSETVENVPSMSDIPGPRRPPNGTARDTRGRDTQSSLRHPSSKTTNSPHPGRTVGTPEAAAPSTLTDPPTSTMPPNLASPIMPPEIGDPPAPSTPVATNDRGEQVTELVPHVVGEVGTAVGDTVDGAIKPINETVKGVGEQLDRTLTKVNDTVSDLVDTPITETVSTVVHKVDDVTKGLTKKATDVLDAGVPTLQTATSALKPVLAPVTDTATELQGTAINAIEALDNVVGTDVASLLETSDLANDP